MNFDLLTARALFEQPHRLTDVSYWHQHIPLAFLLTELVSPRVFVELGTWKGDSYCAFCQAVASLNLPTRCHAVDTWEGDAHTGPYPPEVFEEFRHYHDPLYGAFSTLIRSTFEEALEHFANGTVDLLHIDGHHSYASVSQDFEGWQPKLSDRGVVLFHDTNMRERDFGVWKLWEELSPHHPSFEFTHGHGLGVLAVGPNPSGSLVDFLEDAHRRPSEVRRLFYALGDRVAALARDDRRDTALVLSQGQLDTARSELEAARSELEAARSELEPARSERKAARRELAALRSRVDTVNAELAKRDALVTALLTSRSWRLMAPIRAVKPNARRLGRRLRTKRGGRGQSHEPAGGPDEVSQRVRSLAWQLVVRLDSQPAGQALRRVVSGTRLGRVLNTHLLELAPKSPLRQDVPPLLLLPGEYELPARLRDDRIISEAREWLRRSTSLAEVERMAGGPMVSVLLPTFNTAPVHLQKAVQSVLNQIYPYWELCLVDDASTSSKLLAALKDIESWDERIRVRLLTENSGIASATNEALGLARGEFVAMLDHDDELFPAALLDVVRRLMAEPELDAVYTDQCYIDADDVTQELLLKPDWSPTLFCGVMFVGHLLVVRRDIALELGGFDPSFDNVQDYEFMLRLSERTQQIAHVPRVLYGWRRAHGSLALRSDAKSNIEALQAKAVNAHLRRQGIPAIAKSSTSHPHRVELVPTFRMEPRSVSVLVSSSGDLAAVDATIRSLEGHRSRAVVDIVVCDDQVEGPSISATAEPIAQLPKPAQVLAGLNTDYVVCVEAGVAFGSGDWLENLLLHVDSGGVGVVGPLVLALDGSVEEAGRLVVAEGTVPAMQGWNPVSDGHAGSLSCAREVSAVAGICAVGTRSTLDRLGGLSELYGTLRYAWIDLSLRAQENGLRNVITPRTVVRRVRGEAHETPARHGLDRQLIREFWRERLALGDPFHNPNFEHGQGGYQVPSRDLGFSLSA